MTLRRSVLIGLVSATYLVGCAVAEVAAQDVKPLWALVVRDTNERTVGAVLGFEGGGPFFPVVAFKANNQVLARLYHPRGGKEPPGRS